MENQGLKTVSQIEKATKNTVKTTPYAIAGYIGLFLSVLVAFSICDTVLSPWFSILLPLKFSSQFSSHFYR